MSKYTPTKKLSVIVSIDVAPGAIENEDEATAQMCALFTDAVTNSDHGFLDDYSAPNENNADDDDPAVREDGYAGPFVTKINVSGLTADVEKRIFDRLETRREVRSRDDLMIFLPQDGLKDGFIDAIVLNSDTGTAMKVTVTPDGEISHYRLGK